jgi:putative transposase
MLAISRSVYRYQSQRSDDELIALLQALAAEYPRWGFWKLYQLLRGQGYGYNHKRVLRVYRQLGLNLRVKPKKRLPSRQPRPLKQPDHPNEVWSFDFMYDSLSNGRSFRTLNIIDDFNREGLWIEIDTSLPSTRVIRVLEYLADWRGLPRYLRSDNGPEFIAQALADWSQAHQVT